MYFDDPKGICFTMEQVCVCGFVQKVSCVKCTNRFKSWYVYNLYASFDFII